MCISSPYSFELSPIEQLWSVVKNKVKHGKFLENETLMTRASETYDSLHFNDFKGFI